jgi:hypothetical protein
MVEILDAVPSDGLPAVEAGCAEALNEGAHSADVTLNVLARRRDPGIAGHDHHARGAAAGLCAGRRLHPIATASGGHLMELHVRHCRPDRWRAKWLTLEASSWSTTAVRIPPPVFAAPLDVPGPSLYLIWWRGHGVMVAPQPSKLGI